MKNWIIMSLCCLLSLSVTACSASGDVPNTPAASDTAAELPLPEETDREQKPVQMSDTMHLSVNNTAYPIPIALKQLLQDGWKISDQPPYFLEPMVGEDYYEMRTNWSLSKDGTGIVPGGSIIRLLEKDGVLLEVTISNRADLETETSSKKIEDCVVDSMTVFYDEVHTSIQLNHRELRTLTPEILLEDFPTSDGWVHCPNNYRDHPEFGVSTEYSIFGDTDNCARTVSVSFDPDNTAFKVSVLNEPPLE